jgi:hypothetical protein
MSDTQEVLFAAAATATALASIEKALASQGEDLTAQAQALDENDPLRARSTDFLRGYVAAYESFQVYAEQLIEKMSVFVEQMPSASDHNIGGYL